MAVYVRVLIHTRICLRSFLLLFDYMRVCVPEAAVVAISLKSPPFSSPTLTRLSLLLSLDQERLQSSNAASSPKIDHVRHPIKPRTMAQAQIPVEDESLLDASSDADITIVQKCMKLLCH